MRQMIRSRQAVSPGPVLARLAVLLEAGLAPSVAWRHLAEAATGAQERETLTTVAHLTAEGLASSAAVSAAVAESAPGALAADEWRQAAAVWQVAEHTGAPLGPTLRRCAEAARDLAQARREAATASAGPRASARVVLLLPVAGVVLSVAMGVDAPRVLVGTPTGWACLIGASALVALARWWMSRLVRAAEPSGRVPGLELDLVAVALGGGGSWAVARERASAALGEEAVGGSRALDEIEALSLRAGVPGAGLLRVAADDLRREARAQAAAAAERLGVHLLLPLGVCLLPAFVLVGVVPLGIALFTGPG